MYVTLDRRRFDRAFELTDARPCTYHLHAMDVQVETYPTRGFPELTSAGFGVGRAYLSITFGPGDVLADNMEMGGLTLLAEHLRTPPICPAAFFEDLHVPRELRGKGIGSAILKYALAYMRKIDICEVYLQASAESSVWQRSLMRLYERFGFTVDPNLNQYSPVMYRSLRD